MQPYKKARYRGKEVSLFPIDVMNCSQIAGLNASGQLVQKLSHNGTYAYDFIGSAEGEKRTIYAPVTVICTKKEEYPEFPSDYGNRAWFVSKDPVKMPSGDKYIYFYLIHNEDISELKVNDTYTQGAPIYTMGEFGISKGVHVHIEGKTDNTYPEMVKNDYAVGHMIGNEQLRHFSTQMTQQFYCFYDYIDTVHKSLS